MESTSRSNEQPEEPAGERSESASCLFAGGQTGKTTAAASLRAVHFVGVRGTRRDALVREVGPLFHGVHDLDGLVRNAYVAAQHMMVCIIH
jgi:hypothetical protein